MGSGAKWHFNFWREGETYRLRLTNLETDMYNDIEFTRSEWETFCRGIAGMSQPRFSMEVE